MYALIYYHTMEFTSETPPQGLHAYFGVEGPYLLAGVLVIRKVMAGSLNPLKARRSVVKYSSKRVPKAATQRALEAAIMAPNHFLSEPWRFYTAGPETKAKLCGLNADKRKAAEGVPEWLIVTCASAPVCRIQGGRRVDGVDAMSRLVRAGRSTSSRRSSASRTTPPAPAPSRISCSRSRRRALAASG